VVAATMAAATAVTVVVVAAAAAIPAADRVAAVAVAPAGAAGVVAPHTEAAAKQGSNFFCVSSLGPTSILVLWAHLFCLVLERVSHY